MFFLINASLDFIHDFPYSYDDHHNDSTFVWWDHDDVNILSLS